MTKFTPAYLKKLEDILKEHQYEVRYEKGNFKSGYCVLEAKKVVVINKFSTLESRIQALIEIIRGLTAAGQIEPSTVPAALRGIAGAEFNTAEDDTENLTQDDDTPAEDISETNAS